MEGWGGGWRDGEEDGGMGRMGRKMGDGEEDGGMKRMMEVWGEDGDVCTKLLT